MSLKIYKKTDKTKLSANFKVSEFACHGKGCCSTVTIDEQLVKYVQKIRDHFGKPVTITSGYRCATHNKNVGGATGSRHAKGQAADIVVKDVAPAEVAKYAESIGILGIGLYETAKDGYFVHIDTRTTKSFWYGQGQASRSTFGGASINTTTKIDSVREVQTWLNNNYASGLTRDGLYGSRTKAALVKALQKELGFADKDVDGIFGKKTKAAIKSLRRGDEGNLVKVLQGLLICNGYKSVYIDGDFGGVTDAAVKLYQHKKGFDTDGVAGKDTFAALCA